MRMRKVESFLCALGIAAMCVGCTAHVSMTQGDMSSDYNQRIADDLVSVLMRTDKAQTETVYLHDAKSDNGLQLSLEESLRAMGWKIEGGDYQEASDSTSDLVIAYRAETFDAGRFGSYCLLIDDEASTICREYNLVTGTPTTSVSVTGMDVFDTDTVKTSTPKTQVLREYVAALPVVPTSAQAARVERIVLPTPAAESTVTETKPLTDANTSSEDELFDLVFSGE